MIFWDLIFFLKTLGIRSRKALSVCLMMTMEMSIVQSFDRFYCLFIATTIIIR